MQRPIEFQWSKQGRAERMRTIVAILATQPGLTTRMIAHRLGLKKTPYVRHMLIELMEDQQIHYEWQEMTNQARVMIWYPGPFPPEDDDLPFPDAQSIGIESEYTRDREDVDRGDLQPAYLIDENDISEDDQPDMLDSSDPDLGPVRSYPDQPIYPRNVDGSIQRDPFWMEGNE